MDCKQKDLLKQIYELDFVCVDLNLFLDTHPDNEAALMDYNCYCDQLKKLRAMYENNYGPLYNFGNSKADFPFSWQKSPWPWENCQFKEA